MTMILHKGAVAVPRSHLANVPVPAAEGIYHPIPHAELANLVQDRLKVFGFDVIGEKHALSKTGEKYFGYYELEGISSGYSAVVGFRSSYDKSLAVELALGSRVFICDNLALSGDIEVFRKHTTMILAELPGRIEAGVKKLPAALADQDRDFTKWQNRGLNIRQADHAIGELYRNGILSRSLLGEVFDEFRHQTDNHGPRTLWSLFNATTKALKSETETGHIINLPNRTKKLHKQINVLEGEFQEAA